MSSWHKREEDKFILKAYQMPLEEYAALCILVDLIHHFNDALVDDDRSLTRYFGGNIRVWKRLKNSLLERGEIYLEKGLIRNADASQNVKTRGRKSSKSKQGLTEVSPKFAESFAEVSPKFDRNIEAKELKNKETENRSKIRRKKDSESYTNVRESITDSESHPSLWSDDADASPDRMPAKEEKKYDFEGWWEGWRIPGTKRAKGSARIQYDAVIRTGKADNETLITALNDFMSHCEQAGTPVSKIIHPERWLKRERWSDELVQDQPWENRNARPTNIRPDGTASPFLDFVNGHDTVSGGSDVPRLSAEQPAERIRGNGADGNLPSSPDRSRSQQARCGDHRFDSDFEVFAHRR